MKHFIVLLLLAYSFAYSMEQTIQTQTTQPTSSPYNFLQLTTAHHFSHTALTIQDDSLYFAQPSDTYSQLFRMNIIPNQYSECIIPIYKYKHLPTTYSPVHALTLKANDKFLFTASGGIIHIIDLETQQRIPLSLLSKLPSWRSDYIDCNNNHLITLSENIGATLWDIKRDVPGGNIVSPYIQFDLLALTPNGQQIITACTFANQISVWDIKNLKNPIISHITPGTIGAIMAQENSVLVRLNNNSFIEYAFNVATPTHLLDEKNSFLPLTYNFKKYKNGIIYIKNVAQKSVMAHRPFDTTQPTRTSNLAKILTYEEYYAVPNAFRPTVPSLRFYLETNDTSVICSDGNFISVYQENN